MPARVGTDTRRERQRRRRAIVTGGAGFVGSHLVERLLADGVDVMVIDDLSTGRDENLATGVRLERLDVASDDLLRPLRAWRPELVFHLAAQASVPLSIEDPLRDLAVNVAGTHRVGEAARAAGARRLVFVSSGGAIYGETQRPATEQAKAAPASYYGVHKLAAEGHVALAGLPYVIVRPSNIYGPRQTAGLDGAVVAAFVTQALASGSVRIHGDGTQTRDFVDVRDVVDALQRLSGPEVQTGIWNIAAGRPSSINSLADLVEGVLGHPLLRTSAPGRTGDVAHSSLSAGRLRAIGWRPEHRLASGIAELIQERRSTLAIGPAS